MTEEMGKVVAGSDDESSTEGGCGAADGGGGSERGDRAAGDMWRGVGTMTFEGEANMAAAAAARK